MTLEELEQQTADTETLNAIQVASVLNVDPQWLRDQARNGTFPLPFPFFFSGSGQGKGPGKKLVVPKRRFLRYMRGEDVDRLHELLGALIEAVQIPPETLNGWHYTINGPTQERRGKKPDLATVTGGNAL